MPLHHFFWEGKERSVAMNTHDKNQISFFFIDREIVEKVSARILLGVSQNKGHYLNKNEISSLKEAENLLACIEEAVGSLFR